MVKKKKTAKKAVKSKAVAVLPKKDLQQVQSVPPSQIISEAIARGSNLAELEKVMELQERYEAGIAKKAFVKAMAEFKTEDIVITKDKVNKQYDSKYTTIGNLIKTVTPFLSNHGFSASWDIEQNGVIKVICKLTHCLGHFETASLSAGEDKSGAKSAIQQIKSTITYLKGVTFESVCGLASSDANLDDDGNSAPPSQKPQTQYAAPEEEKVQDAEFTPPPSEMDQAMLEKFISRAIYFCWSPKQITELLLKGSHSFTGKISKSMKVESFNAPIPLDNYNMLLDAVSKKVENGSNK